MEAIRPYLTITEIALLWRKNPTSVRRALDSKRLPLEGYKSPDNSNGTWLITADSCQRRWGFPRSKS